MINTNAKQSLKIGIASFVLSTLLFGACEKNNDNNNDGENANPDFEIVDRSVNPSLVKSMTGFED